MNKNKFFKGLIFGAAVFLPFGFVSMYSKKGDVYSWGFGRNGELGTGSEANISLPQMLKNINFIDIDAKKSFSAAVTSDGKLYTWGKNRNGVLGHHPPNLNVLIPR
jgi:alpha-tubulin suppressor-like RCC1 family protein